MRHRPLHTGAGVLSFLPLLHAQPTRDAAEVAAIVDEETSTPLWSP